MQIRSFRRSHCVKTNVGDEMCECLCSVLPWCLTKWGGGGAHTRRVPLVTENTTLRGGDATRRAEQDMTDQIHEIECVVFERALDAFLIVQSMFFNDLCLCCIVRARWPLRRVHLYSR